MTHTTRSPSVGEILAIFWTLDLLHTVKMLGALKHYWGKHTFVLLICGYIRPKIVVI